jgi:hypothetical protein
VPHAARRLLPLLVAALAGGALGWYARAGTRSSVCPGGPPGQHLEADLELLGHGAWYGFTLDRPGLLRIKVDLPEGVASTLVWGRLGVAAPGEPGHLPDASSAERIPISGPMTAALERRPIALGPHVLFVEQPPLTMGAMHLPAHVTIEVLPDAGSCRDAPR